MSLSKKQLEDVCMYYGGHKACRYLVSDPSTGKHMCGKLVKKLKEDIDARTAEFLKKMKANNQDPQLMGRPLGDNCQGYIFLKYKKQGYDV